MTLVRTVAGLALVAMLAGSAWAAPGSRMETRREGLNLNSFVQQGAVAAHVVLRSGTDPRLIVAFPAGNSGVGLWFAPVGHSADWTMTGTPRPTLAKDDQDRTLRGVTFRATIHTPRLAVRQAVLSSVRVLRDYQALGKAPPEVLVPARTEGKSLVWARDRLDGAPGYRLAVKVEQGTLTDDTIAAGADGAITLTVTALTGEIPLAPFPSGGLLTSEAAKDPGARAALQFLSYRQKFMAGSWRFNTYFGRDTLMSVRLLMPALKPEAVETGLRSVFERLSPDGNVAHEEDIGEFAVLDHMRAGEGKSDAPTFNYNMIDSPFLLAPVARAWLIDDKRGQARAVGFLGQTNGDRRMGDALITNLRFVIRHAQAFADTPRWDNLVSLKPGMDAGEWRDSNDGLGGGRYPYDVNAILVPAALDAIEALNRAGLLDPFLVPNDRALLDDLPRIAKAWRDRAPPLFLQTVTPAAARPAIERYARAQGVPAAPALAAMDHRPIRYHAIALDKAGKPVPILNSDEGFALLFGNLAPDALEIAADTIDRPFPAGLMTGAGLLVANPVFAPPALQKRFSPNAYHGTVIWSWHQALAAAGLRRQLERTDLPVATCRRLRAAENGLWRAIDATRSVQSSELWSWHYDQGGYRIVPFGANGADVDESNAAQLWSTVYLALHRPAFGVGCLNR
ncbi:MAG TPA: hypothetical protein VK533_06305 [Sphingomonas sp.]|uniref:hypothetical protein n=1 Tax=Sphingomonas sp. TaxID=28214 RepID=UPI002C913D97|nr:hypothetical protein [Sphingomonas sp.]HMI19137.1 hypothetical protein [Sphingomonas sp.]